MVLTLFLLIPAPAWAVGSVLSGIFDGSEPAIEQLLPVSSTSPRECVQTPLGYRQSSFTVSTSGTYSFKNAFGGWGRFENRALEGVDVTALVYLSSFDASDPSRNLLASGVHDDVLGEVSLDADTAYMLVVQQWCQPVEGAWAVTFTGPGSVSSDQAVVVPSFTSGVVADDSPSRINPCLTWWDPVYSRYQQTGPIQVSRDGQYYFVDAGAGDLCLSVYTAPVDPDDGYANFVATTAFGHEWGPISLQAGKDYYFIAQPGTPTGTGEYFYILAPPAPFRINSGMADSWYNPDNPGQGFFLDVFENLNQVFLGWFTYAIDPVADDEFAHRWMTAVGPFSGVTAKLAIDWTAGGAFDAAEPAPESFQGGTIELEFTDCSSGLIRYALDGDGGSRPAITGVIPIERITDDSVALCESLYHGPGTPGPL
jgi:hypothetical protein